MRHALETAKQFVATGNKTKAIEVLASELTPEVDFSILVRASKWARSIKWDNVCPLRVAFLGGGTLEHLIDFISFWLLLNGFRLESYFAQYDAWRIDVVNTKSLLYKFKPDIVWFFTHSRDIKLQSHPEFDWNAAKSSAEEAVEEFVSYWQIIQTNLGNSLIFQNNVEMNSARVFGHLEAVLPGSRISLTRLFNIALAEKAAALGVKIFDLEYVASSFGLRKWHNHAYWHNSKHPFSPDLAGLVAFQAARLLAAAKGASKKVVVLDLDNTLWGGVIGDDGLEGIKLGYGVEGEAFSDFQNYLKFLAERGIVLAVSSKNEESTAKAPFLGHPGMKLSLNDIAVFNANWENKADNIRRIALTLNLGLDSFVFVDDNPAERALIKSELPMVTVPEMPDDPSRYVSALDWLHLFESMTFSSEDKLRGRLYRENADRAAIQADFTNIEEYLANLEMVASVGEMDSFHLPRMAQLVNKSNQFHLTTTRYTESELLALSSRDDYLVRWFSLRDRFGDYGLIAGLILKKEGEAFLIDTWVMSCRVLERGMEEFILRHLIALSISAGHSLLIGRYIPTAKNALVRNLYGNLGFTQRLATAGTLDWFLDIPSQSRNDRRLFIKGE